MNDSMTSMQNSFEGSDRFTGEFEAEGGEVTPERSHEATLEEVRAETAASLESQAEFARTAFARESAETQFRDVTSAERRRLLLTANDVISDEQHFADPEILRDLLTKINEQAQGTQAVPEEAEPATLQQVVLELVNTLFYEQVCADLLFFNTEFTKRVADAQTIAMNADGLLANQAQEDPMALNQKLTQGIEFFQQLQIDRNIFDQYIAHAIGNLKKIERSAELTSMEDILTRIIKDYATVADTDTNTKLLQIDGGSEQVKPSDYLATQRDSIVGTLTTAEDFSQVIGRLQAALEKLSNSQGDTSADQQAKQEVVKASAAVSVVAGTTEQQDQPEAQRLPSSEAAPDYQEFND